MVSNNDRFADYNQKRNDLMQAGICPECDPPGSGKECRGGPCYTCKGSKTYPVSKE